MGFVLQLDRPDGLPNSKFCPRFSVENRLGSLYREQLPNTKEKASTAGDRYSILFIRKERGGVKCNEVLRDDS